MEAADVFHPNFHAPKIYFERILSVDPLFPANWMRTNAFQGAAMAYDEALAKRMRKAIGNRKNVVEKSMFGGIAFMLNGNLCCGIHDNELVARINPADTKAALLEPGAHPFDITGRPMKGWISVRPSALAGAGVAKWVRRSVAFAEKLPKK
jgi:hypothetical protein